MLKVHNFYLPTLEVDTVTLKVSGRDYTKHCLIDGIHAHKLKEHVWCFESSKGQMYTMDFTGKLPDIFKFHTYRVYLWRYICYLHTNNVNLIVSRSNLGDYRVRQLKGFPK